MGMAITNIIKQKIEPYVRSWLPSKFPDHVFTEKQVLLTSNYHHRFDAVSEDGSIVGAILCNRPKTRTGNENTGGVRKAMVDACLLNFLLPEGTTRAMIFTDERFSELAADRLKLVGTAQIQMLVCPLPQELRALLGDILDRASAEQRGRHDS
jgi:hypothetical protein